MVLVEFAQVFPVEDVDRVPRYLFVRLAPVRGRAARGKDIHALCNQLIHDGKADP